MGRKPYTRKRGKIMGQIKARGWHRGQSSPFEAKAIQTSTRKHTSLWVIGALVVLIFALIKFL